MSATPRVDAMRPHRPGPTRTAPPRPPDLFPSRGRYRSYIAFGSCGVFLMISAFYVLSSVWALGNGEAAWNANLAAYRNPLSLIYNLAALIGLVWFTLRFFRLFPKTQPSRIGPAKRPPEAVFALVLNGAFAVVSLLVVLVLWGAIP